MIERGWYFGKAWNDRMKPVFNLSGSKKEVITISELRKQFTEETNIRVKKPYSIDEYTKDYTEWLETRLTRIYKGE